MDWLFTAKVIAAFVCGGLLVIAVTSLAERLSPRAAGVVSALPTTAVTGLVFITIATGLPDAVTAMTIFPTTVISVIMFTLGFAYFYPKGIIIAFISATIPWSLFAVLAFAMPTNIWVHVALFYTVYFFVGLAVGRMPSHTAPKVRASKRELASRALLAGAASGTIVVAVKLGGPLWGGIFTCLPATIVCTLHLMSRKYGVQFARSIAKNMPHGSAGTVAFGVVFYFVAPHFSQWVGLLTGIIAGYCAAIPISMALSALFKKLHAHPRYLALWPKSETL